MSQNKALTEKKLTALWNDKTVKEIDTKGKKIVMFSDMHLGDGGKADDFRDNRDAFLRALDYYMKGNFTVMLLGDIEEFWQFDLDQIVKKYDSTVYKKFRGFRESQLFRINGNHDSEWGAPHDPARNVQKGSGVASEALKLKDKDGTARILLIHGHQGSTESDKNSWISRVFVRLYKKIEPVIKIDRHASATKSQIAKNYERIMYSWAKKMKVILICGHSHRAIFASRTYLDKLEKEIEQIQKEILDKRYDKKYVKKRVRELEKKLAEQRDEELKSRKITALEGGGKPLPCYFNTGCALFSTGITAIEIEKDEMRLVKWSNKKRDKEPRAIFDKGLLSDFVKEVA